MEPIRTLSTTEAVTAKLREEIFLGSFRHGEKLRQEKIAERYQVSRMPVRDAFRVLEMEGLITIQSNKHALVNELSEKTLLDHFELRILLETKASLLAAQNHETFQTLEALVQASSDAVAAQDRTRYSQYNERFHRELWHLSENQSLEATCAFLWRGISSLSLLIFHDEIYRSYQEHQEIIAALKAKEEALIVEIMRRHIGITRDKMMAQFLEIHKSSGRSIP